ncbi:MULTISPECIES: phage holin family protein [unclassified Phenylobacterium]|uniref:phage holin family protein n=1 Tax=unclassified Phenylobacterium TaxID=2640670 RepID=UPI0022B38F87|nr:phage holin family protein [Phenylobacterium sp. NIBR 498073]MBS0490120.1 phage holin family protein [Pseudomonadota bacterium]WGU40741.1 phage holin family protein [Phenylobacterium sp. NIBR 498073]
MTRFIARVIFAALGLALAAYLLKGVGYDSFVDLLLAAVLLGVLNAVVRPILFILTLPLTIVTLGLFLLVLNAAMIGLVAWMLPGFWVHGFWSGVAAAIITGLASWAGGVVIGDAKR